MFHVHGRIDEMEHVEGTLPKLCLFISLDLYIHIELYLEPQTIIYL